MKAWELISTIGKWTRGSAARTCTGVAVHEDSADATCWCAVGAIARCYPNRIDKDAAFKLLAGYLLRNSKALQGQYDMVHVVISRWNDDYKRTHQEVFTALHDLNI